MTRVLTIDDVKGVIGNLARPNYYQFDFSLQTQPELTSYLNARGIDSSFITRECGLLCNAATLPGSNLATTESYNYVGVKENFAHTLQYDQMKLEFYCDDKYKTLKFFEGWINFITSGSGRNDVGNPNYYRKLRYPSEYKIDTCRVTKFNNSNRDITANRLVIKNFIEYSFVGMFPTDIYETPLLYGDDAGIMSVTVGFSFDRHIMGATRSIDVFNGSSNNIDPIIRNTLNALNAGNIGAFINI